MVNFKFFQESKSDSTVANAADTINQDVSDLVIKTANTVSSLVGTVDILAKTVKTDSKAYKSNLDEIAEKLRNASVPLNELRDDVNSLALSGGAGLHK